MKFQKPIETFDHESFHGKSQLVFDIELYIENEEFSFLPM
jgi:hypothetical protein